MLVLQWVGSLLLTVSALLLELIIWYTPSHKTSHIWPAIILTCTMWLW